MDALRKMLLFVGATVLALTLVAGPALAADAPAGDEGVPVEGEEEVPVEGEDGIVGEHGEAEGGRIQIAQTPRDQVGLILLGSLLVGGALAFSNARRQLKGERPTASGEFRWR